jgi:hypothetical protein
MQTGRPAVKRCRFCGKEDGEIHKGAHQACKNADDARRHREKKGPPKCQECGVVVGKGRRLCDTHRDERNAQQQIDNKVKYIAKQKELRATMPPAKRGRPPAIKPPRRCACGCGGELPKSFCGKYVAGHSKPKVKPAQTGVFKEAKPVKELPLEGVIIVPEGIKATIAKKPRWMASLRDLFGVHGEAHNALD